MEIFYIKTLLSKFITFESCFKFTRNFRNAFSFINVTGCLEGAYIWVPHIPNSNNSNNHYVIITITYSNNHYIIIVITINLFDRTRSALEEYVFSVTQGFWLPLYWNINIRFILPFERVTLFIPLRFNPDMPQLQ